MSRALVSVQSRYNQVIDETSSTGKALNEWYEEHNIQIYDQQGQLLKLYDVLSQVAEIWPTLTKNEQAYYLNQQAGANQTQNLSAILSNFSTAVSATETALNSAGSAAQENSRYMEGLEAKTQAVKATFEEVSNTIIDSELIKGILDLTNAFLQFFNLPIGTFVAQVGLLTGVLWGGSGLIKAMKVIPSFFSKATSAVSGLTGALSLTAPQLVLIAAIIAGIIAIAPAFSDWWKEWTNDVDYANEKLEENSQKLSDNKKRLEELNKVPVQNRTADIQEEINSLQKENEELEKNIGYWENKNNLGTLQDIEEGTRLVEKLGIYDRAGNLIRRSADQYIATEEDLQAFAQTEEEAIELLKQWGVVALDFEGSLEELGYTLKQVGDLTIEISNIDFYDNLINSKQKLIATTKDFSTLTEEEKSVLMSYNDELENYYDALTRVSYEELNKEEKEHYDTLFNLLPLLEDLQTEIYNADESLRLLNSGFNLNKAQAEVLIKKYPQLADLLTEQGELYSWNTDNLYSLAAQGNETARQMIRDQIDITNATIQQINQRIETYKAEMRTMSSYLSSLGDIMNVKRQQGSLTSEYTSAFISYSAKTYAQRQKIKQEEQKLAESIEQINNLQSQIDSWSASTAGTATSTTSGTSGKSGSSTSNQEIDIIEEQYDKFKELNEIIEHNINMRKNQGASTKELVDLNKKYLNQLHEEADWFRKNGLSETSKEIRELQTQWWSVKQNIIDLQRESFDERLELSESYINEKNELDDWGADNEIAAWNRVVKWMDEWYDQGLIDYEYYLEKRKEATNKAAQAEKEAWEKLKEEQKNQLEEEINLYEILFSSVADKAQEEIDKLQDQRQEIVDKYQEQIDALEQINEELDNQIEKEEALDSLAKARQTKVMVYKDGRFQYVQDIDKVSEAQSNLEEIKREEDLRKELERLEELRDKELEAIDSQIEAWEKYKEEWASVVDNYQTEQDKLIAEQILGIKLEGDNWKTRLDNLSQYIQEYNDLMSSLNKIEKETWGQPSDSIISGNSDGSGIKHWGVDSSGNAPPEASPGDIVHTEGGDYVVTAPGIGNYNPDSGHWSLPLESNAKGTLSSQGGLSLVGENGPELRVLNKGEGIIPSDITKNLWSWGVTNPSSFMNNIINTAKNKEKEISIIIQNFNPNLPNVTDGQSFANYMKNNFWRETVQFAKA